MVNTREDIWQETTEFLLKEYGECWRALIDTYHRNESWFRFYITVLALVGGIVGVILKIEGTGNLWQGVWLTLAAVLIVSYALGIAALCQLCRNRKVIVLYRNATSRIRKLFVERAEAVGIGIREYIELTTKRSKALTGSSVNLLMIYVVSFCNFLTLVAILLICEGEITGPLALFLGRPVLSTALYSFVINSVLLALIIVRLRRADQQRSKDALELKA